MISTIKVQKMHTKIKGIWNGLKGKFRQQYAVLTDNEFLYEQGRNDEILGKLQIKLGKTREVFDKIIPKSDQ